MKFSCLQENIKQGLNIIERIIGKNLSLPVLNTVLIETQKNYIKLCSTDLKMGISCWITGKVEREGSVCVPAKILSSYVNNLPNKKIEISAKENKLNLECESYKTLISGFGSGDFPIIPQVKEKEFILIDSYKLCQGLSKVIGAVSLSETKPEISGVSVNFKNDFAKFVATDSFRLAESAVSFDKPIKADKSIIVPSKTIQEVIRIFNQPEEARQDLEIYSNPHQILFARNSQPKIQLTSRLIEGEYPNYEEIIPKGFLTKITFNKNELSQHVKIASFFSGRTNDLKIKIDPDKKMVEFYSSSSDTGEHKSEIFSQIEGEKIETTFNCKYLMDGLANIEEEEVILELNGEDKPGVLKPSKKKNYIYIVMPIKAV